MAKKSTTGRGACKVCNHPHILEIETASIIDLKSSRQIAEMILENGWEPVSYVTIVKHLNEHITDKRRLVIAYLDQKRKILEGELSINEEDIEKNEFEIRLGSLQRLDKSESIASILVEQAGKALMEQLSLRDEIQDGPKKNPNSRRGRPPKKIKTVGVDRKPADIRKGYVPLQKDLIMLYKNASEELRQTIREKLNVLGIDSNSKAADNTASLVDLIMADSEHADAEDHGDKKKKKRKKGAAGGR